MRNFGWLLPSILIAQQQKKKKKAQQGFGAVHAHHSRMVEHWSNLVEANTKITAQSLAIRACRKASYNFMQAAMAVGALGAHVVSGPRDEHMEQVIRAHRQDLVNLSDRLAKCRRG